LNLGEDFRHNSRIRFSEALSGETHGCCLVLSTLNSIWNVNLFVCFVAESFHLVRWPT
jgi:hypothetical protein